AGEIDIALYVPPDSAKRLQARGIRIQWAPIGQGMQLTLKLTIPSPLADLRVRQALNYAIDKELMVNEIMGGFGPVLGGQLASPSAIGFNPALQPYPYDVERAKRLLAEAGHANGFQLDFDGSQGRYLNHKDAQEFLVGEYKKIGVDLRLQILEFGAHIDKIY